MITTWTDSGDTVFDPFTGAGTTAKMCLLSNRKFHGTEISLEYCDIIKERLLITLTPPIAKIKPKKSKQVKFANPELIAEVV
jgi:DNA modification methylase